jgi:addiction module RelE/StbE family toxin
MDKGEGNIMIGKGGLAAMRTQRLKASDEFRADTYQYRRIIDYEDNLRICLSTLELGNDIKRFPDRALEGDLQGFRECEFRDDFVLLYRVENEKTFLVRAAPRFKVFELEF